MKATLKSNPLADSMRIEDRLIMEKHQIEAKKENMRREKEEQELSMMKDKPFVRESSVEMGLRKIETMRQSKGLSKSVQKHEELYLDFHKKVTKKDLNADEIKLKTNLEEYTFQPNTSRGGESPSRQNISGSFEASFRKKPSLKPQLNQGRPRIDPYKIQEK